MAAPNLSQDGPRTGQVKIQLSSRSPDIDLPDTTGPILVSTGNFLFDINIKYEY